MSVRCKFRCVSTFEKYGLEESDPSTHFAKFETVSCGSEENEKFFSATPIGFVELGVMKEQKFECGKEYYFDISPSEG